MLCETTTCRLFDVQLFALPDCANYFNSTHIRQLVTSAKGQLVLIRQFQPDSI